MTLSIRQKLLLVSCTAVVTTAAVGLLGVWGLREINARVEALNVSGQSIQNHMNGDMMHDAVRADVLVLLRARTAAEAEAGRRDLDEHLKAFSDALERNAKLPLSPEIAAAITEVKPLLQAYQARARELAETAGRDRAGAEAKLGAFMAAFSDLETRQEAVSDLILRANEATTEAARLTEARARMLLLVVTLGAGALLTGLAVVMTLSILRPLAQVTARLREVSSGDGDLTARVEYDRDDELGDLARSFNTFVGKLEETIAQVTDSATALAAAAEQMSSISVQITNGSEAGRSQAAEASAATSEVSTSVQSVAAGVEQLSAAIREIARNASEAAGVASEAAELARTAHQTVDRLGTGSAEIGQVLQSITAIAQKTNLLALNATIEAARAGEAGKGFAVVATEVKELANQAGASAEDVGGRIQNVQAQVQDVVVAIRRISDVVAQINARQGGIASAVEEQSAVATEMGRAVEHAAEGSGQIARLMSATAGITEASTAAAGEASHAAQELARMAAALQGLVGQFRTGRRAAAGRAGVLSHPGAPRLAEV